MIGLDFNARDGELLDKAILDAVDAHGTDDLGDDNGAIDNGLTRGGLHGELRLFDLAVICQSDIEAIDKGERFGEPIGDVSLCPCR